RRRPDPDHARAPADSRPACTSAIPTTTSSSSPSTTAKPDRLQRLDLHFAPLDDATGSVLGTIAELEGERSLRVLAVLNVGGLDSVQHDGELRTLGRDLVGVPFAAGLGHR